MHTQEPTPTSLASWAQLEHSVERLHEAARMVIGVREFYRRLLEDAKASLAAVGGAAWRLAGGHVELICQVLGADADPQLLKSPERRALVQQTIASGAPAIHPAPVSERDTAGTIAFECLLCPVRLPGAPPEAAGESATAALIELWLPAGAGPLVQRGWIDFITTLAEVAGDYHAIEELRRWRESAALQGGSVELLRRVGQPRDLDGAAFEVANEGRRLLGCDRLSVVVRRRGRWRLVAVSGVDRIGRRTDFTRRTERLSEYVARWGEPFAYPLEAEGDGDAGKEMPPRLATTIEAHIDHSHARELACTPVSLAPRKLEPEDEGRRTRRRRRLDAVLIAERFEGGGEATFHRQLVELGELCGAALGRAVELDRFPIRSVLRWSSRLGALSSLRRLIRAALVVSALAGAVAALVLVPADFDVEAPATLVAAVERDVFATASGAVSEIRVAHGQLVAEGEILAVLSDPELALKLQQVRGEIESTRKRLDAMAVTRTERTLRENQNDDRLPLSAEQRQLEERLNGLAQQRQLLETRRDALMLRSPRAGQVLTRDVQSLLESRPVERGQVLLTIADPSSGWELVADVPQRKIGHVLKAQGEDKSELPVSYRLAGDVEQSYPGHIVAISSAAALDADALEDDAPPVEVRIAVEGDPPVAARPGMTASVRIHCGQRPLGYVWLYDVGATIYRWVTF